MTAHIFRCCSLLIVVVTNQLFVDAAKAETAKTFRWKFEGGQVLKLKMTQTTTQTLSIGGQEVEIPTSMVSDMTWRVNDDGPANPTVNVTQTIDRMRISMDMPNLGQVEFDSDDENEPAGLAKSFSDSLRPLIGAEFVMTITDRGKIVDVKIPEEALTGFATNPIAKQMMSPESLRQMMTQGSIVLPEEAIDDGYKWSSKATMKTAVGDMDVVSNYTYAGDERRGNRTLSKFLVDMDIQFDKAPGQLGAMVKVVDQDNSGVIYFDAAEGRMADSNLVQKMTMNVTVGGQSFDQKLKTEIQLIVTPGAAN